MEYYLLWGGNYTTYEKIEILIFRVKTRGKY